MKIIAAIGFATSYFLLAATCAMGTFAVSEAHAAAPKGGVRLNTPNPTNALEYNERAIELASKGLWDAAVKNHETALQMDPHNKTYRTNLSGAQLRYGNALKSKGNLDLAMRQYRGAIYIDPNNAEADNQLDDCITRLHKDPHDYNTRFNWAERAEESADFETAIVEYQKCVKMRNDGPTHARLGRALVKSGKIYDGYASLRNAVAKDWNIDNKEEKRDCATTHRQLGDVLKDQAGEARKNGRMNLVVQRLQNAGICYRRAVTLNPSDTSAIQGLVEVSREAVSMKPTFDNHLTLAGAYLLSGDFAHAKQEYEQCYRLDPKNPLLLQARYAYHYTIGTLPSQAPPETIAESITKVKGFLEAEPESAKWWFILGQLYEKLHDPAKALECFQKADKINAYIDPGLKTALSRLGGVSSATAGETAQTAQAPQSKEALEAAQKERGYLDMEKLIEAGDLDAAQNKLMEMISADKKDGRAAYLLGNVFFKRNDLDQATVWYRLAAACKAPGAQDALDQMNASRIQPKLQEAESLSGQEKYVEAAGTLRDAINMAPNLPLPYRKLGEILKKMGDSVEADKQFKKADQLEKGKT